MAGVVVHFASFSNIPYFLFIDFSELIIFSFFFFLYTHICVCVFVPTHTVQSKNGSSPLDLRRHTGGEMETKTYKKEAATSWIRH